VCCPEQYRENLSAKEKSATSDLLSILTPNSLFTREPHRDSQARTLLWHAFDFQAGSHQLRMLVQADQPITSQTWRMNFKADAIVANSHLQLTTAKGTASLLVPIGAVIVTHWGWDPVFYIASALNIFAGLAAWFWLRPMRIKFLAKQNQEAA
jgi:hypothetical protein